MPANKTQNAAYWVVAFLGALLIAFLMDMNKQLPGNAPIDWREAALAISIAAVSGLPLLGAGLGLPSFGSEQRAALVSQIGKDRATTILTAAANDIPTVDYDRLADLIIEKKRKDDAVQLQVRGQTVTNS